MKLIDKDEFKEILSEYNNQYEGYYTESEIKDVLAVCSTWNIDSEQTNCERKTRCMIDELTIYKLEEFKYYASQAMIQYGGSFTQGIGYALQSASPHNARLLMRTFWDQVIRHYKLQRGDT